MDDFTILCICLMVAPVFVYPLVKLHDYFYSDDEKKKENKKE